MPELPEVETISLQLNEVLMGLKVKEVVVHREKNFLGSKDSFVGKVVRKVGRKAKMVGIEFEGLESILQVHLKMTGQLIFVNGEKRVVGGHPTADWVQRLPSKHTRVEIGFEDGSVLFFNDMRAFGWMRIADKELLEAQSKILPPDVVDLEFTLDYFGKVLKRYKRPIKIVLLDQQLVGGIGNIYANDALNLARVLPSRSANSLSMEEMKTLRDAIIYVIDLGIKSGGASSANYVDTKGLGGTYQNYFLTYKREGQPCKNCGEKIVKIKLGGRGTFYCPRCQK